MFGLSGLAAGSCAQGFGICCVLSSSSCGGTVSSNLTYIRNPGYPSTYSKVGTCEWKITKVREDICQIRLDFQTLVLADPNVVTDGLVGRCEKDSFQGLRAVAGDNSPLLCGYNTGHHLYIDAGAYSAQEAGVKITLAGGFEATWNILVSMIECSSRRLPPAGCLQFLTGASGTVSSFNFRAGCTVHPCTHLQDHRYTICVRQEADYCSIGWRAPNNNFHMTNLPSRTTAGTEYFCDTSPAPAQADNFGDYIIIPDGVDSSTVAVEGCSASTPGSQDPTGSNLNKRSVPTISKFCGAQLSCIFAGGAAEVISKVVPFTVGVVLNDNERTTELNKGFQLNYRQLLC